MKHRRNRNANFAKPRLQRFLTTLKQRPTSLACTTCCSKLTVAPARTSISLPLTNMIDTVILSLPTNKAVILDMAAKGVFPWDLQSRTAAYDKYVRNPSHKDQKSGLYFPRITGFKRKQKRTFEVEKTIKIEFSAPKLLYKNNVDELADSDFAAVVETLHERLQMMGVVVTTKDLESAAVRAVHYSKNIELQNGYTSQYVISELNKIDLNKRFDLTRARYMNDGQSLYAYTISNSLVIYDKVADLIKDKKRAIDKEQTPQQLNLFAQLTKPVQPREILRFETRLSQKQKMNSLFKELGFAENPTFRDVFSTAKSKAVMNRYWSKMVENGGTLLFGHSLTAKDLLKQILLAEKKAKPKEVIYRTGLLLLLREGNGMRELRSVLSKRSNDRTWYRLAIDAKETGAALNKLKPREWFEQIKSAFTTYQPFKVDVKQSKVI